ncbi:hypothetical protein D8674_005834 [Pyrus ussuriensis x Pyrus communis]|uniref:Uncharacterized protein n=1 Tax=Pyrus ussuriensis x Pyrus communis TaxID=2448454 RepID=A0A5N5FT89_9ROSA|nr:hypothetical protein D8674_005834 [Pyrus ussuriensis x Pyrus communis]
MLGLEGLECRRGTKIRETNARLTEGLYNLSATSAAKAITLLFECNDEGVLGSCCRTFLIPLQYVTSLRRRL